MYLRHEAVINQILNRIIPNSDAREKMKKATELVMKRVISEVKKRDFKTFVEVGGSVAKDTWLGGEADKVKRGKNYNAKQDYYIFFINHFSSF